MELLFKALMENIRLLVVPFGGMVSREDFVFRLIIHCSRFGRCEKMILVSFNEEYGKKVTDALNEVQGKEIVQFRMNEPDTPVAYKWDMLAFPVMQALGIRADEL